MNDEIKATLEWLKECGNNDYIFETGNSKMLLDYITNLQQELEEYKDTETYSKRFLYKANKNRLNANLELVKENERLKLELSGYREAILRDDKLLGLQQRIEKAVEYLKKHIEKCNIDGYEGKFDNFDIFTKPQKLLNILEGKSDE